MYIVYYIARSDLATKFFLRGVGIIYLNTSYVRGRTCWAKTALLIAMATFNT